MHDLPLITTIAAAFTAAWVLGLITQRLKLSPIVGYLLAGVVIGPYTPGFVGDVNLARQLAEIGVILLMFGVGLHFNFRELIAVRDVAIPGALGQSLIATLFGALLALAVGWPFKSGIVLGMAMAVASTVVLIRVLTDNRALDTTPGHVAIGWLIVEDLLTVVVLVLIPAMGSNPDAHGAAAHTNVWLGLLIAIVKLAVFAAALLFAGSRFIPWIMVKVARLRSRELFTLTVLVMAIAIATGSYYLFGASMALGAFLAGIVVGQSVVSQQAAAKLINPEIKIFVRAHYIAEQQELAQAGADAACFEEAEAAVALSRLILQDQSADDVTIRSETRRIRERFNLFAPRL